MHSRRVFLYCAYFLKQALFIWQAIVQSSGLSRLELNFKNKKMNWNSKDWNDLDDPLISDETWKNIIILCFLAWLFYQTFK